MAKYIDKDELETFLNELRENLDDSDFDKGYLCAIDSIFGCYLDNLKVKEVDLDFQRFAKEMDAIFALPSSETKNTEEEPLNWEYSIAKHFYSLGLAQKGERV